MKYFYVAFLMFLCIDTTAQSGKDQLGFQLIRDFDSYSFNSVYYTNQIVEGNGHSTGFNAVYKRKLGTVLGLYVGSGLYKYQFNIERGFLYSLDTVTNFGYSTKKYSYMCIPILTGFTITKRIGTKTNLSVDGSYTHYFGISEKYKPSSSPETGGKVEKITESDFSADAITVSPGLQRPIKNITVGIELRVPIWERWKKDQIFKENESEYNSKSIKGIGLGLSIFYSL